MKIDSRYDFPSLLNHFSLPKRYCECGVADGKWSETMFSWGCEILYLIDIWERVPFIPGCGSFEQQWHDANYERVKMLFEKKENVTILKGFSYKMAEEIPDESLGMAYIDAGHDYYSVRADIESLWSKLVPGGILAFHDFGNPEYEVWRAVKWFAAANDFRINTLIEDGEIANIGCWIQKPF